MADKKNTEKDIDIGAKTPTQVWASVFMLLVLAGVFLPSTIVFTICMVPTLVAAIVDNQPNKTAWLTIGSMNLAGTIPVWVSLIDAGHTIAAAFQIVMQPTTFLIAYGGAAGGVLIYNYVTPMIAALVLGKNERRIRDIEKRQKELVRKWGEAVILR